MRTATPGEAAYAAVVGLRRGEEIIVDIDPGLLRVGNLLQNRNLWRIVAYLVEAYAKNEPTLEFVGYMNKGRAHVRLFRDDFDLEIMIMLATSRYHAEQLRAYIEETLQRGINLEI